MGRGRQPTKESVASGKVKVLVISEEHYVSLREPLAVGYLREGCCLKAAGTACTPWNGGLKACPTILQHPTFATSFRSKDLFRGGNQVFRGWPNMEDTKDLAPCTIGATESVRSRVGNALTVLDLERGKLSQGV
eukprot:scaffold823_cov366-Pavlova_lutheri.AAC.1